jgi:uncharacterized protein
MKSELLIERVQGAERIASLDIIRGVAILFILVLNIRSMGTYGHLLFDVRYPTWTSADYWSSLLPFTFLLGTQRGLLELLFGAGIMIMARRAMAPDGPVEVADIHFRRNLWLCLFGLANAFVLMWFGDILLVYGLAAVFLFPFRKLGPKAQCGLAAIFLGALILSSAHGYREETNRIQQAERIVAAEAAGKALSKEDKSALKEHRERLERRALMPADNAKAKEKIAKADKAHHSTFGAYWNAKLEGWLFTMGFFWTTEAEIVATMLIGMALFQWGIIQGRARSSLYWAMLVLGYGIGLALGGSYWLEVLAFQPGQRWQAIFLDVSRIGMTFGHLALIHLIVRTSAGYRAMRVFDAPGRMPLTVYLFTSFLMMWIVFAPWGLGLWGAWGHAKLLALVMIVIAGELAAANMWLRHFETGPMEWLWKSLTYWRRQPFRKPRGEKNPPAALPV